MNYKIKHTNNVVVFEMRTGKDLVRSKMGIAYANSIVAKAKTVVEEKDRIIVDDTYFFPIEHVKTKKTEEDAE